MKQFRLGTTSYILPADILPNARYLAGQVEDIELVLFEVDDGQNNLPSAETIAELGQIAVERSLSYTVHLPLDLRLGADGGEYDVSLLKAQKVIERTRALNPWAYVLHLDGRDVRQEVDAQALRRWQDQAVRALEIVAGWAGGAELLAVENLESYPLDFLQPVLERVVQAGRCVDIGHLWLDGHDPLPYLRAALDRTRVIHLHGARPGEHAHRSLTEVSQERLDAVLKMLVERGYSGVLTLEIFGVEDFHTSLEAVRGSLARIGAG